LSATSNGNGKLARLDDVVLAEVVQRIARGQPVLDAVFDRVYPPAIREASSAFWTPVRIALHAAELLTQGGARRVLDVGSGVGKFCLIGAAATNAQFVGVEHRVALVDVARRTAKTLGVRSALFVHGTIERFDVDVTRFDGLYLFNPFEEHLWPPEARLDDTVEAGPHRFYRDVATALEMLDCARADTRVVTYHGLGAPMPSGWQLSVKDGHLELWIKSNRTAA
jgi:SAM-dependent methyltransferase